MHPEHTSPWLHRIKDSRPLFTYPCSSNPGCCGHVSPCGILAYLAGEKGRESLTALAAAIEPFPWGYGSRCASGRHVSTVASYKRLPTPFYPPSSESLVLAPSHSVFSSSARSASPRLLAFDFLFLLPQPKQRGDAKGSGLVFSLSHSSPRQRLPTPFYDPAVCGPERPALTRDSQMPKCALTPDHTDC